MEPNPNKFYHHFNNDTDISWGWFVDIDNDWNTNNIRQIIRISNNYKGALPPICEIDEEILEPDEISKNQFPSHVAFFLWVEPPRIELQRLERSKSVEWYDKSNLFQMRGGEE
jgi:hypothetical protein